MDRKEFEKILNRPLPATRDDIAISDYFRPWDLFPEIYGDYSAMSDILMILALHAVKNGTQFEFIRDNGFVAEFMLYVLVGHGLTEYGTSPRTAWPHPNLADLFPTLIQKWKDYYFVAWDEDFSEFYTKEGKSKLPATPEPRHD